MSMITRLEVTTAQGVTLDLPFELVSDGIFVAEITGLEPVKASLVSSSFAMMDGAQYHSSRRDIRNLILKLGLDPDFATQIISDLRNSLYSFFMPKTQVRLRFHVDTGDGVLDDYYVDIYARIETFESPLFVQEPEVVISMICFDPDFYNPIPVVFNGMTTSGLGEETLVYSGTVETGILLTLLPNRSLSAFTVYHRPPDGTLRMLDFSAPLLANDVLRISTSVGKKSITRTRANVESSLLYAMSPQSNWLELQPGANYIRVYAEGVGIPFSIEYTTKYGGL